MERWRGLVRLNTERSDIPVRSGAMRIAARRLGLLAAVGVAGLVSQSETGAAAGSSVFIASPQASVIEARASRYAGQRRRRARRERTREAQPPPAAETRAPEIVLPKRNPRRPGAEPKAASGKGAPAKSATNAPPPPPAVATPDPAPPPPVTWSLDEVLEGRERCLMALASIVVEIDPAPPMRTGQCGSSSPVLLRSIGKGAERVIVRPPAMLNCEMVQALHDWIEKTVQPTARETFGEDIVRLESVAGYQCRNRARTDRLSEHALANAIDILGFTTRSGHTISVLDEWGPTQRDTAKVVAAAAPVPAAPERALPGEPPLPLPHPKRAKLKPITARATLKPSTVVSARTPTPPTEQFLKRVHERSCEIFKTVLGPEANEDHRNHFHLDLAQRKRGAHYCR